jgi:cobalt-zinc-cadmium efflux system outer membrane protein
VNRLAGGLRIGAGLGALLLLPWLVTAHAQLATNPPASSVPAGETNDDHRAGGPTLQPSSGILSGATNAGLSLADARRTALERNWDLLAAKSGIDAATAQLIVSKEFPNPSASLSIAKIGTHEAATILGNSLWERSYDSIAAINQLIEIGGKRHDRQIAARAGVRGAKARFYDARRTLDQGVTKAYIAALLAAENARVLAESAKYMRQEADIAQTQFNAGDISEADKKTLEINAAQFELQSTTAEAAARQARIAVEVLMGVKQPTGNWTPADSLEALTDVSVAPPPEASPGAVRPDVLAAEADLQGGQAQLQLQKAMRIPDPAILIGAEHNPPGGGPAVDTFLFGLSFPLPLWNQNGGNIKAAQAAVDQFGDALGKIKAQAAADIASAEIAYDEARESWLRYRDELAPKSAQVRESVRFKYERGAATLVDLLNAEQTDNTIRLALAQAMNDTASTAADLIAARTVTTETDLNLWK